MEKDKVSVDTTDSECRTLLEARTPTVDSSVDSDVDPTDRTPLDAPPLISPGSKLGHYQIIGRIAEGGMGVVYEALDPRLNRKVALKLLKPRRHRPNQRVRARLLQEARALARVVDPHVVTVFDVGSVADQVYLAAELVPGENLSRWLRLESRTEEEILDIFLQAGRGLAAAHHAGLVHRDFKPGNVMVRPDGKAVVLDFGLARALDVDPNSSEGVVVPVDQLSANGLSTEAESSRLTITGTFVGTPSYMAPEQWACRPVDARADQFSYCVALYEALCADLPFATASLPTKGEIDEQMRTPPPSSGLPRRIRKALLRGLSFRPEDRHATMDDLLDLLAERPWWRRWRARLLGAAASLFLLGVLLFGRWWQDGVAACSGGEDKLAEIWNERRHETLHSALLATGKPYAEDTWKSIQAHIDAYAQSWIAAYQEACEATHVRKEQSPELLDRRVVCLEQRRQELSAMLTVLIDNADDSIEYAVQATVTLKPLARCNDVAALMATERLPSTVNQSVEVEEIRAGLARAKALGDTAAFESSLALAEQLVTQAEELGSWPLIAEAWLRFGLLQAQSADPATAKEALQQALLAAQVCAYDQVTAEVLVWLVRVSCYQLSEMDEGHRYADMASTVLNRLHHPDELEAELAEHIATLLSNEGDIESSIDQYRQALRLQEDLYGTDHPKVASALAKLGEALTDSGRHEEARDLIERSLRINVLNLGPDHPQVAMSLNRKGSLAFNLGDYQESRRCHQRALAIIRVALGPEHPRVPGTMAKLGRALAGEGDLEAALAEFRKALKIYEEAEGRDDRNMNRVLTCIGAALTELGRYREALPYLNRALAIQEQVLGSDHPQVVYTLFNLGTALGRLEEHSEAKDLFTRALRSSRRAFPENHHMTAVCLTALGGTTFILGCSEQAVPLLEEALIIWKSTESDPLEIAITQLDLAQVYAAVGRDQEADSLAEAAREVFEQDKVHGPEYLADLQQWLESRDGS